MFAAFANPPRRPAMEIEYVEKNEVLLTVDNQEIIAGNDNLSLIDVAVLEDDIFSLPAADVVPWEWLERYADYFCAEVSMQEFVREAKMFYASTNEAMQGGVIDG
jgi:hypothetical protein